MSRWKDRDPQEGGGIEYDGNAAAPDDGVHIKRTSDRYDRITLDISDAAGGRVLVGDGTHAPTPLSSGGSAVNVKAAGSTIVTGATAIDFLAPFTVSATGSTAKPTLDLSAYADASHKLDRAYITGLLHSDIGDWAEGVDDRIATLAVAGAGCTITYDDTANTLTFAVPSAITSGQLNVAAYIHALETDHSLALQRAIDDLPLNGGTLILDGSVAWNFATPVFVDSAYALSLANGSPSTVVPYQLIVRGLGTAVLGLNNALGRPTITTSNASANFSVSGITLGAYDVNKYIAGPTLPAGTYVATVTSATTGTLGFTSPATVANVTAGTNVGRLERHLFNVNINRTTGARVHANDVKAPFFVLADCEIGQTTRDHDTLLGGAWTCSAGIQFYNVQMRSLWSAMKSDGDPAGTDNGYSDNMSMLFYKHQSPVKSGSGSGWMGTDEDLGVGWYYRQNTSGDGLVIMGGKGGSGAPVANLHSNNGCWIGGNITGCFRFTSSYGIVLDGYHWDSNQTNGLAQGIYSRDSGGIINELWEHDGPSKADAGEMINAFVNHDSDNDTVATPTRGSDWYIAHATLQHRYDYSLNGVIGEDGREPAFNMQVYNTTTRLRVGQVQFTNYKSATNGDGGRYPGCVTGGSYTYDAAGVRTVSKAAANTAFNQAREVLLDSWEFVCTGSGASGVEIRPSDGRPRVLATAVTPALSGTQGVTQSGKSTDAATATDINLTCVTPFFTTAMVGKMVVGPGIPANTTIATWVSTTAVTLSNATTATASGLTVYVWGTTKATTSAASNPPTLTNSDAFFQSSMVGMTITGTDIAPGTRILSRQSATSVTLNKATTGSTAGTAVIQVWDLMSGATSVATTHYAAAMAQCIDSAGTIAYGPVSNDLVVATATNLVNEVNCDAGAFGAWPVILYRNTSGGSAASAPDAYAIVPYKGRAKVYRDSGTRVDGVLWNASAVPTPVTVDATVAGMLLPDGKRMATRAPIVFSQVSAATLTPNVNRYEWFVFTALATGLTINAPTGNTAALVDGQLIVMRFNDNGGSQSFTWNAIYRASSDKPLPTATTASKTLYCAFRYNSNKTKWDYMGGLDNYA